TFNVPFVPTILATREGVTLLFVPTSRLKLFAVKPVPPVRFVEPAMVSVTPGLIRVVWLVAGLAPFLYQSELIVMFASTMLLIATMLLEPAVAKVTSLRELGEPRPPLTLVQLRPSDQLMSAPLPAVQTRGPGPLVMTCNVAAIVLVSPPPIPMMVSG